MARTPRVKNAARVYSEWRTRGNAGRAASRMTVETFVRVDLHNHTHYSPDSILTPKQFVREARRRRLDVVAVTDHNTIRGALAVRELADFPVIIGEEVRSEDGEILGLFLSEEIPKGLSAGDTIARIKDQGGIVGVPHPFDSLRSGLREDAMLRLHRSDRFHRRAQRPHGFLLP